MTRQQGLDFCAALQRLMKRAKVSAIEANSDGAVVLHDEYGRRCASFEGVDVPGPHDEDVPLTHFVRELTTSQA